MSLKTKAQDTMPVTPSLISWARDRSGYSVSEAEKHFNNISLWERGELLPTYPQLEQLSKRFKVPVAVFFFPEPPEVPAIDETFRTLPQESILDIPPKVRLLLRKAKVMQINLFELNDGKNTAGSLLTRDSNFDKADNIQSMAQQLREYLNISIEAQCSWQSIEKALEKWRQILIDHGIYVFKDAFREESICGFCLYDEEFPIIYVNNSMTKSRQIFTLFHELAHLIFHSSGIDALNDGYINNLPENNRKIEIICNRFAGKFLVPDDSFNEVSAKLPANRVVAKQIANKFHVSREVIYRKFLDRKQITKLEYEQATDQWRKEKQGSSSSGDYYNNQLAYLGREYVTLAFKRFYENRFDNIQLADYLNIKPKYIPDLEEKYLRGFISG